MHITYREPRYRVKFKAPDALSRNQMETFTISLPSGMGIRDVTNGFWVDRDYEFTQGSASKWFIPACQLLSVEKYLHTEPLER